MNVNSKRKLPHCVLEAFCGKPAYGSVDVPLHVTTRAADLTWNNLHVINFFGKRTKVKRRRVACGYLSASWREILISKRTLLMLIRSTPFPAAFRLCPWFVVSFVYSRELFLPLFGHQPLSLIAPPPHTHTHKAKSDGGKWLSVAGLHLARRCSQSNVI